MEFPKFIKNTTPNKHRKLKALYECSCGKIFESIASDVKSLKTKSCGCLKSMVVSKRMTIHGDSKTKLYDVFIHIISRCFDSKNTSYKNYGGRGITVCDEWKNNYILFKQWALENGYEEGLTVDRINNNGDYSPENCRLVSPKIQNINKRIRKDNTSGQVGVVRHNGKWEARIGIDNKNKYIGRFEELKDAILAYEKAKKLRNENYVNEAI